jgi:hypothetical protein
MKTFISYSTALDQIIALRLQTMAAVYGMTIYVPPASTRQAGGTGLLNQSFVFLSAVRTSSGS